MLLERTITQLDIGAIPVEQAAELGALGFLQWLAGLSVDADYHREAANAHAMAAPFIATSPAIAVFCDLMTASMERPLAPLPLALPARRRRGGAPVRRRQRML